MIFWQLFYTFCKIGIFNFGGGYAMIALIQNEVVENHAWMTAQEFTDIVAVSQMTPGPLGINVATYAGYTSVINAGYGAGWAVLGSFLASFAVPGVKAGQRNTTVEEIESALGRSVPVANDDGLEARQIKSMVEGMKAEARAYIAAGGTIVEYGKRLTERQDAEIAIYERAKADFEAAKKTIEE